MNCVGKKLVIDVWLKRFDEKFENIQDPLGFVPFNNEELLVTKTPFPDKEREREYLSYVVSEISSEFDLLIRKRAELWCKLNAELDKVGELSADQAKEKETLSEVDNYLKQVAT